MSEKSYVPASQLADMDHPSIVWRVALPDYAPAENIMVNVDRLSRLARLGGMESLRIASYSGDTTQVTAEVGQVDDHGTATAMMKGSVSRAETQKRKFVYFSLLLRRGRNSQHLVPKWS